MKRIFSIKDNAIEAFGPTFEARATGEAIRLFIDEAKDNNSRINKHSKDFALYQVAIFDEESGDMQPLKPIEKIMEAADAKEINT